MGAECKFIVDPNAKIFIFGDSFDFGTIFFKFEHALSEFEKSVHLVFRVLRVSFR